ncbi:P-loop NTPase fold protein [Lentzea sp. NPDC004782]|uniref:P-loop NTPase fold protein n=1 Tax=Lentzea sp. NPDC004782 TaxID=3154458 RepID=UPI0033B1F453
MSSPDRTPRMNLDRVIELGAPITAIAVNRADPEDPLLKVSLHGRPDVVVHANTGEQYAGEPRELWPGTPAGQLSLRINAYTVNAQGPDIFITGTGYTSTIRGHRDDIGALSLCPATGEPLLVSGSGTVKLWDIRTGELLRMGLPGGRTTVLLGFVGTGGRPKIASGGPHGSLHIWDPQLALTLRTGPVSTRGFSDRVAAEDLLDRGALVDALTDVLRPGDDDGPTVITVEGAWGSGKSTLLELIKQRMTASPATVPRQRRFTVAQADWMLYRPPAETKPPKRPMTIQPLVVSFNPWRHQSSEQVWAGLAKAISEAAEAAIMPHQHNRERYWFARNAGRVDRRHLQRQLWKRIYSPLLSFAGLGFGLSLLGALTKLNVGWAWWATAGLAAAGLLHTGLRYLFGKASAFLPGELFAGPVSSNAFSSATTDPLIRDPYYHARSGYLYLVQHDVRALLRDLDTHGYRLILLIDDLDRCTPRTTAQVFEAINVFLSDDFPATRFVLGLDTAVVAAHVDNAYKELADAKIVTHPDDPSPGWTFLRKLVQLPVRLPRTTADNVDRILLAQLGPVHQGTPVHAIVMGAGGGGISLTEPFVERLVIAIERHGEVRSQLRNRLRAQPEQSVREEKRLLNVWQFYLRMLGSADVEQACHLVAVAEIAVRWPAYLHRLRGAWQDLADTVHDDVRWGATIARLGFAHSDRKAAANLRQLLRDCDAQAVAALANRVF